MPDSVCYVWFAQALAFVRQPLTERRALWCSEKPGERAITESHQPQRNHERARSERERLSLGAQTLFQRAWRWARFCFLLRPRTRALVADGLTSGQNSKIWKSWPFGWIRRRMCGFWYLGSLRYNERNQSDSTLWKDDHKRVLGLIHSLEFAAISVRANVTAPS